MPRQARIDAPVGEKEKSPHTFEDVNLRAMLTIRNAFPGIYVGYSDHTPGIEVAVAAVALGAAVLEKHFTLDRNLPGPDHKASLEPDELKVMVQAIRNIEKALGDGIKRPSPGISPMRWDEVLGQVAQKDYEKDELI